MCSDEATKFREEIAKKEQLLAETERRSQELTSANRMKNFEREEKNRVAREILAEVTRLNVDTAGGQEAIQISIGEEESIRNFVEF